VINSGDAKILLVEDTLFFRRIIANVLEGAGHTVTVANNGQEAVELLEKSNSPFDLIVSDIEMPRMNGFDFAKSVRDSSVHKETPLVALSSRNDTQYQKRGVEAGFDVYLEKMKPEVLLEVVSNLVVIARKSA
jgi:CheY-like chemotaxis protein